MRAISVGYVSRDFGIEQEILFFSAVFWVLNLDHSSKVLLGAISVVGYVSRDFEIEQEILFFFAVFWVRFLIILQKSYFGAISVVAMSVEVFFFISGFFLLFSSVIKTKCQIRTGHGQVMRL